MMQIRILDQIWQFDNKPSVIEDLFEKIDTFLNGSDFHLNYMIIDGRQVYEDFQDYIFDNIIEIQTIEIKVSTLQQMSDDILLSTDEYLMRALPIISDLVNEFYHTPSENTWHEFAKLLEGIEWLLQVFQQLNLFNFILQNLQINLNELIKAVEHKDTTLIGDVLQYEISQQLETLLAEVKRKIDNEVVRYDLN